MKITDIITLKLEFPLRKPIEMSFGKMTTRKNMLIRIDTDEGISGIGETWTNYPFWAIEEREITVHKGIKPLLINENPLNISAIQQKLYKALIKSGAGYQWGAKGPLWQAISGIDTALWDILGKKLNVPVYQLLGGKVNTKIQAYASGLGPKDFEADVQESLNKGYTAFKLKVGFGKDLDLHNLKTVREIIGDDNTLMIDANQGWNNSDEAIRHLKLYEKFNIRFIEEPVPAELHEDLKRIKDYGIMPVAGGENVYSSHGFKDVFAKNLLDIVQPDIAKVGGISHCKLVCTMADTWGIPYAPHMFGTEVGQASSLHILASTPNGLFMEVEASENDLLTNLVKEKFYMLSEGSFVLTEDRPGLGIDLNMELVKEVCK